MQTIVSRRGRTAVANLTAALLLILAWDASGLDLPLSQWFGTASGFAARDAFWARAVLHEGLRYLWIAVWLGLAIDAFRRRPPKIGPSRTERRQALLIGMVLLIAVPTLKSVSQSSCPWSLVDFGGSAPWIPHWDSSGSDGGPGHCFPSGHTAGAFAFSPFAWIWRRRSVWFLLGTNGGLASVAQLARGAHFLSHSLWAGWICVALGYLLLQVFAWREARSIFARPSAAEQASVWPVTHVHQIAPGNFETPPPAAYGGLRPNK